MVTPLVKGSIEVEGRPYPNSVSNSHFTPDLRTLARSLGDVRIKIPYRPRDVFKEYHARKERFAITVAHRRAGKSVAEINECVRKALSVTRSFPPPQVAFISPTFGQAKRNVWSYAKHYSILLPGVKFSESDLTITFPNNGKLIFAGSDNFDSLRGMYLDHASMDEYGDQDPRVWGEVVRPALSDYGGSATFIGSAKGRNHFYDLLKAHEEDSGWLVTLLKASQTGILSDEELKLARATMTEAQYQQEYECSFDAAVTGTFYAQEVVLAEDQGRITSVPWDKAANVYAAFDLGIGGASAIWIYQMVGMEIHFIGYYEAAGEGLAHYCDWLQGHPFRITELVLPHDAEAKELQTGETRRQFLEKRGFRCHVLGRNPVDEGISDVLTNFPRFWFDKRSCARGIDVLRMYRRSFDDKKKVFSEAPLHDWASHGADAMRYAVAGLKRITTPSDWSKPLTRNLRGVV
jgi:hypothetical protein